MNQIPSIGNIEKAMWQTVLFLGSTEFFAIFLKYTTFEGVFFMFLWAKQIQKLPCLLYLIQIFGMKLEEISRENAVGTFCIRNAPSEMKKKN